MVTDRSQVCVLPVDWMSFARQLPEKPPLLEELLVDTDQAKPRGVESQVIQRIQRASGR